MGIKDELRDKAAECFALGARSAEPEIASEFIRLGFAYELLADREHRHAMADGADDALLRRHRRCPDCNGRGVLLVYASRALPEGTEVLELAGHQACGRCNATGEVEI